MSSSPLPGESPTLTAGALVRLISRASFGAWFALFTVVNTTLGVVLLSFAMGWAPLDALYFVVTALTTVGFGDLNVASAGAAVKLYVVYLMLCGAGSYSVLLALLINRIVGVNLREYFEGRSGKMKDHVILCGFGNLGSRIYEELLQMGEPVVIVDSQETRFVQAHRPRGALILIGDAKLPEVLSEAGVESARCIVAATDDDLGNLETALNAREANPAIRVVLRMYDQSLAEKMDRVFDFGTILSASRLAAPSFAHAVTSSGVAAQIAAHGERHVVYELTVPAASQLAGMTCGRLFDGFGAAILSLRRNGQGATPETHLALVPGDEVVLSILEEKLPAFLALGVAT